MVRAEQYVHSGMLPPTHKSGPKSHPLIHLLLAEVSHHLARIPGRDHILV